MTTLKTAVTVLTALLVAQMAYATFCGYKLDWETDCCKANSDCRSYTLYVSRGCCFGPGTHECVENILNALASTFVFGSCGPSHVCCTEDDDKFWVCQGGGQTWSGIVPQNSPAQGQLCS
jgi:hypothetical protein